MSQKRYSTFRVCDKDPAMLSQHLEDKLNSLIQDGWHVERIDCISNNEGLWDSELLRFWTTQEYIIVASVNNI